MIALTVMAFLLSTIGYLIALVTFPRIGLLDFPERYNLRRKRIPYPTGIIAITVFLFILPRITAITTKEYGIIASVIALGITCLIDDRRPLPFWLRLAVQLGAALTIFLTGSQIYTITHPFEGFIQLDTYVMNIPLLGMVPLLSAVFTVGWLLLTTNAVNWFDGIGGQVSVVSTVGFTMIGCLAMLRNDEPIVAAIAFALAGIAGAGTLFDLPPSRMLLGDTGSMFFGLMLGLLGVYQGGKVATVFLALGIPLIDALAVVGERILRGDSPFHGGRDHLHHRLLAAGFRERTIVLSSAAVGAMFGISALFLSTQGKAVAFVVLTVLYLIVKMAIRRRTH